MNNLQNFFKNLKVVELASVLAGPAVGLFFAELGAEVIKVENKKTGGDVTRNWKLPNEDKAAEHSAYYCSVNWNKRSHLLDLRESADRQKVLDWISEADVLISNFKLTSARKMGLDYDTVKGLNARLIYAQLTSFGEESNRVAFDIVLQAEAGFLYMTGEPDREPVRMSVALIDILAAHQLKEGILIAMLQREHSGVGAYVSTSLIEAALASLANQATNWLMGEHIPQRMGTMHPNIAPYGDLFYTKDKKPIILAAGTELQFKKLCQTIGREDLIKVAEFETNAARVRHRSQLKKELAKGIQLFERDDLLNILHQREVPVGSIRNMKEVFELETARKMLLEDTLPNGQKGIRVSTVAFKMKQ